MDRRLGAGEPCLRLAAAGAALMGRLLAMAAEPRTPMGFSQVSLDGGADEASSHILRHGVVRPGME